MREIILILGLLGTTCTLVGQGKKVEISASVNRDSFFADQDVVAMMKTHQNFEFKLAFKTPVKYELLLCSDEGNRKGSIFAITMDELAMEVYHEEYKGNEPRFNNRIVKIGKDSSTYIAFNELVKLISPGYFTQKSQEKVKYYKKRFFLAERDMQTWHWGIFSLNGREFKDESNYPGVAYGRLVDFILLEFGWMP